MDEGKILLINLAKEKSGGKQFVFRIAVSSTDFNGSYEPAGYADGAAERFFIFMLTSSKIFATQDLPRFCPRPGNTV